jgi:hypothetical protein
MSVPKVSLTQKLMSTAMGTAPLRSQINKSQGTQVYNNLTAGYMSGGSIMYDTSNDRAEEDALIKDYELALEIKEKVKKITKYANDNKLDVQETLESFFSEEELDLYENLPFLRDEISKITSRRKKELEDRERTMQGYIDGQKIKSIPGIQQVPYYPVIPGAGDIQYPNYIDTTNTKDIDYSSPYQFICSSGQSKIDEKEIVLTISKMPEYTHLIN